MLNTIRDAADAAGLAKKPPRRAPDDEIPIGGGAAGGAVWWQGEKIELPAFPAEADQQRVFGRGDGDPQCCSRQAVETVRRGELTFRAGGFRLSARG